MKGGQGGSCLARGPQQQVFDQMQAFGVALQRAGQQMEIGGQLQRLCLRGDPGQGPALITALATQAEAELRRLAPQDEAIGLNGSPSLSVGRSGRPLCL